MSAEEDFLKRWSRRKRAAAEPVAAPEPAEQRPSDAAPADESAPATPELPPIESIGPGSDITAFLKPGVPAALSQAALRRAWSADPAIRDFIGLSENSWDFTAEGGVPGFGAIKVEDVARLLQRVIGAPEEQAPEAQSAAASAESGEDAPAALPSADAPGVESAPPAQPYKVNAAVRDETTEAEQPVAPRRRRHGGALPD